MREKQRVELNFGLKAITFELGKEESKRLIELLKLGSNVDVFFPDFEDEENGRN